MLIVRITCTTVKGTDMNALKTHGYFLALLSALLMAAMLLSGCQNRYENLDLSMYHYRDTKNLVKFVYGAAALLEKEGMKELDYFRSNRNLFITDDYYLYIYYIDGTNIFHAGMKHLEGKNIAHVTDKDGKKPFQAALDALEDPHNPHAWVHYSWWEPGKFYPVPKSSCHFKVTTPEGKQLLVGGGLNYPFEEKEFIRIIVDSAVDLIKKKGHDAFSEISDPFSQYHYRDVCVFAFLPNGDILISPIMGSSIHEIQLFECTDQVGHKPFMSALSKLQSKDCAWEIFMVKSKFQRQLVKKCLYLCKTVISGEEVFVGAITNLPMPV